jgi:y4mF family transcriptional regulator
MAAIKTSADFGEQIRLRRKALGLTQQQLAARCGVGVRFIIELEGGKPTCQLGKSLTAAVEVGLLLRSGGDDRPPNAVPPPDPDDPLAYLPKF